MTIFSFHGIILWASQVSIDADYFCTFSKDQGLSFFKICIDIYAILYFLLSPKVCSSHGIFTIPMVVATHALESSGGDGIESLVAPNLVP